MAAKTAFIEEKDKSKKVKLLSEHEEKAPPMIEVKLGKISALQKFRYMFMVISLLAIMGAGFYAITIGPDQIIYKVRVLSEEFAERNK